MAHTPKTIEDVVEISDSEEETFEKLLPLYLKGELDIEKVRQVSQTVANLLEGVKAGLKDAKTGRVYTREEFNQMMAEDD